MPDRRGVWFSLAAMLQWIQVEKGVERPAEPVLASALELACDLGLLELDGQQLRAPCARDWMDRAASQT